MVEFNLRKAGLIVLVMCLSACSDSDSLPSWPTPTLGTGPFVVTGKVLDFLSNTPVAGATVQYSDRQAVSNASGVYRITVSAGDYAGSVDREYIGVLKVRNSGYRG